MSHKNRKIFKKRVCLFLTSLTLALFIFLAFSFEASATAVYPIQYEPNWLRPENYSARFRWYACIGGVEGSQLDRCTMQVCNIDLARNPDLAVAEADCPSPTNANNLVVGVWETRGGIEGCYIYNCPAEWEEEDLDGNPVECLPFEALENDTTCVDHGGFAEPSAICDSGRRCGTSNIDRHDPHPTIDNESACWEAGGLWHPAGACFIYQRSIVNVEPEGAPAYNKCNIIGEKSCMRRLWSRTAAFPDPVEAMGIRLINVTQGPNEPDNLRESSDEPCGLTSKNNYFVNFLWDYTHDVPYDLADYQIRISNVNSFPLDGNDDPQLTGDEFQCNAGSICQITAFDIEDGDTVEFKTDGPYGSSWGQWLRAGRFGQRLYWTVRARDDEGYWSEWAPVKQTNELPPNPYPWVYFDWEPFGVPIEDKYTYPADTEIKVDPFFDTFTDGAVDRNRSHVFSCPDHGDHPDRDWEEGMGDAWDLEWSFFRWDDPPGDWTQLTNADIILDTYDGSPHKLITMFDEPGRHNIKLEITDRDAAGNILTDPFRNNDPMVCDRTLGYLEVIWRLPKYREVAPRI